MNIKLPVFLLSSFLLVGVAAAAFDDVPSTHDNNDAISYVQEHGIVECSREFLGQISVGDIIGLLPVHSCLTVNLMRENYLVIRNEK